MLRVEHLRNLAATCRNLARELPQERAANLLELASDYERQAQRRLLKIQTGTILANNAHPGSDKNTVN